MEISLLSEFKLDLSFYFFTKYLVIDSLVVAMTDERTIQPVFVPHDRRSHVTAKPMTPVTFMTTFSTVLNAREREREGRVEVIQNIFQNHISIFGFIKVRFHPHVCV